jgi:hypothetical protein
VWVLGWVRKALSEAYGVGEAESRHLASIRGCIYTTVNGILPTALSVLIETLKAAMLI